MILSDRLRDGIDVVVADMETQLAPFLNAERQLIVDALAGSDSAYRAVHGVGRNIIAPFIDQYGTMSAALSADWYDANRDLAQVAGSWSGAVVQRVNVDTGPLVGGVLQQFVTFESVVSELLAGAEMRVRQAAQGTIMDSTLRDPGASGWGRVASAGCCSYCAMLASRGNVYRTQQTATFCPHFHCRCQAVPAWGGSTEALRSREDTIATRRQLTDEQRATQNSQARAWIRQNQGTLGLIQGDGIAVP